MYIISKHKDYYDGVVGTVGMDKTIVYERNTEEISERKKFPKIFHYTSYSWKSDNPVLNLCNLDIDKEKTDKYYDADGFIVGFCGKLYLGWQLFYKVMEWKEEFGHEEEITKTDIVYGYENAKQYLKTEYWGSNAEDDIKYFNNYDPIEVFREFNTPVFLYDSYTDRVRRDRIFFVNPVLKDWEFYKAVDAFTAFTELQMFISGVLGTGEKEIIEISNEHKIEQHGFDRKWSFRQEPTKKH